jgi:DNA-binding response OmpR family regulator
MKEVVMRKQVMIVDDEVAARTLVSIMLRRAGYEVIEAHNGLSAKKMLDTYRPDLFIVDVMMPGIDGIELCRQLRTHAQAANTPILILSARSDHYSIEAGLKAGASGYLTKPVLHQNLIVKVGELIGDTNSFHSQ